MTLYTREECGLCRDAEDLLRKLKTACGAGGTLKDGELEVQGDQRAKLKALLEGMGYRVKGA